MIFPAGRRRGLALSTARDHDLHVKRRARWESKGTKASSRPATGEGISGVACKCVSDSGCGCSDKSDVSLTTDSSQSKPFSGIQPEPESGGVRKDDMMRLQCRYVDRKFQRGPIGISPLLTLFQIELCRRRVTWM